MIVGLRHFQGAWHWETDEVSAPEATIEHAGSRASDVGRQLTPKLTIDDIDYQFLRDASVSSNGKAPVQVLSRQGELTKGALDYIGVDQSKRRELQQIINAAYAKIEATVKTKMSVIEDSDEQNGKMVYLVPAFRGEGEGILREMATNLAAVIGETETMMLLSKIDLSKRYSLFGMNDTRIEITARGGGFRVEENFGVQIVQTDPETKRVLSTLRCSFDGLRDTFGSVFEITGN